MTNLPISTESLSTLCVGARVALGAHRGSVLEIEHGFASVKWDNGIVTDVLIADDVLEVEPLSVRAAALVADSIADGSVLVAKTSHAALGELIRAGYDVRPVRPAKTNFRDIDALISKGFLEFSIALPAVR